MSTVLSIFKFCGILLLALLATAVRAWPITVLLIMILIFIFT